jgi:alpha-tubulin suppressor-like RCC1 family protein
MEEEITPAVVTCGNSHTACITRRGMLYTFGLGNRGELGLGRGFAEVRGCHGAWPSQHPLKALLTRGSP